jgi:hypothetical protein
MAIAFVTGFLLAAALAWAGSSYDVLRQAVGDARAEHRAGNIGDLELVRRLREAGSNEGGAKAILASARHSPEYLKRWDDPRTGDRLWRDQFKDGRDLEWTIIYRCTKAREVRPR